MTKPRKPIDYFGLDPGIMRVVALLRAAGFETTDSGDGATKFVNQTAEECALPFANVFVDLGEDCYPDLFIAEARRMLQVLREGDCGGWIVEASYAPSDGKYLLMAHLDVDHDEIRRRYGRRR